MSEESQQPFNEQEISDLDTARLALRGAVSTLRTMQDLIANLKAENQDLSVREKSWKARVETMETRLAEIHAKWQESQTLIQDYKQEIATQLRNEIAIEEQEKWRSQIDQVQSTLLEWQKTREIREAELGRTKASLDMRETDVRRLETEKIAFEHQTQAEISELLDKSRQMLKDAVQDAVEEKNHELRETKGQWFHETEELRDAIRRMEVEMKLKEEELQKDFHQRRRELEALWREREEDAWKQAEGIRNQTESALQGQLAARRAAIEKERAEQQADYQQRVAALETARVEQEKTLEALFAQKEADVRERYLTDLRAKEEKLVGQRIEFEQQAARREAELLVRVRKEEETLRNSLRQLEAELRSTVDEEMARRQTVLLAEVAKQKEALLAQNAEEHKTLELERQRYGQENKEERGRLLQEWLAKEADLVKRQQGEQETLKASWEAKQKEWIQDHQVVLDKAQTAVAEKLAVMETVFVDRRQGLEEDFRKRQAELETRAGAIDADRRQAWIRKESELNDKYQALIKEEQVKMLAQLDVQKQNLDADYAKRVEYLEDKRKLLEQQFDQAKAAWQEELIQKEKTIAAQYAVKEKQIADAYQLSLDQERLAARTQIQKAKDELAAQKQIGDDDLKNKERALLARATQLEKELSNQWALKETELQKQLATQYQDHRLELEKQVHDTLQAEIQREQAALRGQAEMEKAVWKEEVRREDERIVGRGKALEDHFRQKDVELHQALTAERATLAATWEKQKTEWIAEHKTLLDTSRSEFDAKFKSLEADHEARRRDLEKATAVKEAELLEQYRQKDRDLRASIAQEKETIAQAHAAKLAEEQGENQKILAAELQRLRDEFAKEKLLLEARERNLEESFTKSKAVLMEELLQKEKNLDAQWTVREKQLTDNYQRSLIEERAKAEAEIRKGTEELTAQKQFWEQDLKQKEQLLAAEYRDKQTELAQLFERKETEIRNNLALQARAKETDLEEKARQHADAEIARAGQNLQERFNRESAARHDELERQRKQIGQRQVVLEEEFKKERTRLRADLEKEKQVWLAERDRQVQDLATEKVRLEQSFAERQALLLRQRETESVMLREEWARKQDEWLKQHQSALQATEVTLRKEVAQREEELRQHFQGQLAENVAQNNKLLEEHRKNLEGQFGQSKAAILEEMLQKEKALAAQSLAKENELTEKYKQAVATERENAMAQVRKALESAEREHQKMESAMVEKREALEAKYRNEENMLRARAEAKELEAAERAERQIQKKEAEIKALAERQIVEETARREKTLTDRALRDKSLQDTDLARQRQQLEQYKTDLDASVEVEKRRVYAEFEARQKAAIAESERQMAALAEERARQEAEFKIREAERQKKFDADRQALADAMEKERRTWQAEKEKELGAAAEARLVRERQTQQKGLEDRAKRLESDHLHQKALQEEHQRNVEDQYQKAKAMLVQDMLRQEKDLAQAWTLKEKRIKEDYDNALAAERATIQADAEKTQRALEAKRGVLDQDFREKESALKARFQQMEEKLRAEWEQTTAQRQAELTAQLAEKEAALQEKARRQIDSEIASRSDTLKTQTSHEVAARREEFLRQSEELARQRAAWETAVKAEKTKLEERLAHRESELAQKFEAQNLELRDTWQKSHEEWLTQRQAVMKQELYRQEQALQKQYSDLLSKEKESLQKQTEEQVRIQHQDLERQKAYVADRQKQQDEELARLRDGLQKAALQKEKMLSDTFADKEGKLETEWAKKEQAFIERFEKSVAEERAAAQAELDKNQRALEAKRSARDQDFRLQEAALKARYEQMEAKLRAEWEQTTAQRQAEITAQLAEKEAALQEKARRQIDSEIASRGEALKNQTDHDVAAGREEFLRQSEELARQRAAWETAVKAEKTKLEERLAHREAELAQKFEAQNLELRDTWQKSHEEWLSQRQVALKQELYRQEEALQKQHHVFLLKEKESLQKQFEEQARIQHQDVDRQKAYMAERQKQQDEELARLRDAHQKTLLQKEKMLTETLADKEHKLEIEWAKKEQLSIDRFEKRVAEERAVYAAEAEKVQAAFEARRQDLEEMIRAKEQELRDRAAALEKSITNQWQTKESHWTAAQTETARKEKAAFEESLRKRMAEELEGHRKSLQEDEQRELASREAELANIRARLEKDSRSELDAHRAALDKEFADRQKAAARSFEEELAKERQALEQRLERDAERGRRRIQEELANRSEHLAEQLAAKERELILQNKKIAEQERVVAQKEIEKAKYDLALQEKKRTEALRLEEENIRTQLSAAYAADRDKALSEIRRDVEQEFTQDRTAYLAAAEREKAAHDEERRRERERLLTQEKGLKSQLEKLRRELTQREEMLERERNSFNSVSERDRSVREADFQRERERLALQEKNLKAELDTLRRELAEREEILEKERAAFNEAIERDRAAREEESKRERDHLGGQEKALRSELEKVRRELAAKEEALTRERARQLQSLSERERSLHEDWERERREIQEEMKQQEKNLSSQWTRKERTLAEAHQGKLVEAKRKAEADRKALEQEFDRERSKAHSDFKDKENRLVARLEQMEKDLNAKAAPDEEARQLRERLFGLEKDLERAQAAVHEAEARAETPAAAPATPAVDEGALGDLVFGIAHQIRNPLAVIRSTTESLMESQQSPTGKHPFQAILNSAELLQDRLEQLIDFTRPIERSSEFVSAHDITRQVEKVLGSRLRSQRVRWDASVSSHLPPVPMSKDHLLSVLLHLATNGLDAMERGGTLAISAKHLDSEKMLEFQITDTGHGISVSDLKEMGRPFFTTRAGKVGLGVAIAKRIAQGYGGEVTYESRMGKGTTVRVRLPLERSGV